MTHIPYIGKYNSDGKCSTGIDRSAEERIAIERSIDAI